MLTNMLLLHYNVMSSNNDLHLEEPVSLAVTVGVCVCVCVCTVGVRGCLGVEWCLACSAD